VTPPLRAQHPTERRCSRTKRSPENSANTSANRWRRHAIEGSKLDADRGSTSRAV